MEPRGCTPAGVFSMSSYHETPLRCQTAEAERAILRSLNIGCGYIARHIMNIFGQADLRSFHFLDKPLPLEHFEMLRVQSPTSRALERSMCNVCHQPRYRQSAHISDISCTAILTSRWISSAVIQGASHMTHFQTQEYRRECQCMSV